METRTMKTPPSPPSGHLWRIAQVGGLGVTLLLILGLFRVPGTALRLLWDVAIPLLPAVFLINPKLWRNVCPLGTLNMIASSRRRPGKLPDRWLPAAGITGIFLLLLMVPARRFLFNENGPVLAVTILAVALLALLLGAMFSRKAGFCNSVCPVLPVERLYGQSPLLNLGNAHCSACGQCVSRGCLDVAPAKSIPQILGTSRLSHNWLQTGFGAFAASFPGFVLGYYLTTNGPLDTAGSVYFTIALYTLASYVLTQIVVRTLNLGAELAVRLVGALAIGLYYWFVGAVVTGHLGLHDGATIAIRTLAFALIALWLWRASGAPADTRRILLHSR